MANTSYSELLKDPRWQKKRLEIFNRDEFRCCNCQEDSKTLNLHHIKYFGNNPWDAPDEYLITFCEECHEQEEGIKKQNPYLRQLSEITLTPCLRLVSFGVNLAFLKKISNSKFTEFGLVLNNTRESNSEKFNEFVHGQ